MLPLCCGSSIKIKHFPSGCSFLREAEIALEEIQRVGLESVINFAIYSTADGTPEITRDGDRIIDAFRKLQNKGATIVGINCFRGPFTTLPLLETVMTLRFLILTFLATFLTISSISESCHP